MLSPLFDRIASDIYRQGYSVQHQALTPELSLVLLTHLKQLAEQQALQLAGTGREQEHQINQTIRRDRIHWLNLEQPVEAQWLTLMDELKLTLNRRLFLGLFNYECHFAHYPAGAFYRKHWDAFKGQANRVLTTVLYLNPDWQESDGGELLIYCSENQQEVLLKVAPTQGTLVTFLSEEFAHEVLPANAHRYSIAGWFRLNEGFRKPLSKP